LGVTCRSLAASGPVTSGRDRNSSTSLGSFELLRHSLVNPAHQFAGEDGKHEEVWGGLARCQAGSVSC
jgi:hypothetical protein